MKKLLLAVFLLGCEASPSSVLDVEAPSLTGASAVCPEVDAPAMIHRAAASERAARAKAERFLFDFTDGVEALGLYLEARECFARAGRSADAARAGAELEAWTGRMNEEYAGLRLRLRVALDAARHREALSAARDLQALLSGRADTPYAGWLSAVRRELERKIAEASKS